MCNFAHVFSPLSLLLSLPYTGSPSGRKRKNIPNLAPLPSPLRTFNLNSPTPLSFHPPSGSILYSFVLRLYLVSSSSSPVDVACSSIRTRFSSPSSCDCPAPAKISTFVSAPSLFAFPPSLPVSPPTAPLSAAPVLEDDAPTPKAFAIEGVTAGFEAYFVNDDDANELEEATGTALALAKPDLDANAPKPPLLEGLAGAVVVADTGWGAEV